MCTYFDNFPLTSATKCLQCKKCMLLKFGSPLDPHTNLGHSPKKSTLDPGHISSYVSWLENRDLNDPRVLVSNSLLPQTVTHVLYPSEKIIIICEKHLNYLATRVVPIAWHVYSEGTHNSSSHLRMRRNGSLKSEWCATGNIACTG